MSTLKAARADNFYYRPDGASWEEQRRRMRKTPKRPRNHFIGSTRSYAGDAGAADSTHVGADDEALEPFRRGSGRGPVIRFEMPFKVICLRCEAFIAKGVRFDAERKAVGNYFSTKIYSFLMSCQFCNNPIVIQTDPQNTDYLCKVGVRKKVETFDTADAKTLELGHDDATKQQLMSNPLFKLECMALEEEAAAKGGAAGEHVPPQTDHARTPMGDDGKRAGAKALVPASGVGRLNPRDAAIGSRDGTAAPIIDSKLDDLLRINEVNSGDWFIANSALRKKFREEKKSLKTIANFNLKLVDENEKDVQEARKITFLSQSSRIKAHFKRIIKKDSGIFSRTCASSTSGDSTIDDKRRRLQFIKHVDSKLRMSAKRMA
ncbi:cell cycle control related protein, putative [Babesia bigemina]|uniref:Cell cycle control related protein, putative n=1 Tax=Babesia bigemina TaxID=5866 RepID=A0A061DA85_BABBI|nr:cell cycle control related protein, putative [Babesia bigemina]CDR97626.1 cell cycle control related protein, putative [Babesia bigemina]|eukprot:XP_012769812.1 cell cycle control related protein, putative [Babesia bigemina]